MHRTIEDFYLEKEEDFAIEIILKKTIQLYKTRIIKI